MKFIILTKNIPPIIDGVGDHTFNLSEELIKNGHEVYIFSNDGQAPKNSELHIIYHNYTFISTKKIIKKILAINPDCIIFQYVPYNYSKVGLPFWLINLFFSIRKRTNIINILFVHEPFVRIYKNLKQLLIGYCQKIILSFLTKSSDIVITSTDYYYNELKKFKKNNLVKLPIASNIKNNTPEHVISLGIGDKKSLTISTFGNRKGVFFIETVAHLERLIPNLNVNIIGKIDSNKSDEINSKINELKIKSKINITGIISTDEIANLLSKTHLFYLEESTDDKGRGGVSTKSGALASAFEFKIPCISKKGDLSDSFFKHKINIYLSDSTDPASLASEIYECLDNGTFLAIEKNLNNKESDIFNWTHSYNEIMKAIKAYQNEN